MRAHFKINSSAQNNSTHSLDHRKVLYFESHHIGIQTCFYILIRFMA